MSDTRSINIENNINEINIRLDEKENFLNEIDDI